MSRTNAPSITGSPMSLRPFVRSLCTSHLATRASWRGGDRDDCDDCSHGLCSDGITATSQRYERVRRDVRADWT